MTIYWKKSLAVSKHGFLKISSLSHFNLDLGLLNQGKFIPNHIFCQTSMMGLFYKKNSIKILLNNNWVQTISGKKFPSIEKIAKEVIFCYQGTNKFTTNMPTNKLLFLYLKIMAREFWAKFGDQNTVQKNILLSIVHKV